MARDGMILAFIATFFIISANAGLHTDPDELQAVYEIMAATGNGWAAKIPDVCKGRWHGIECSPPDANGTLHVTSLSFGALSDDTAFPTCTPDAFISPAIARLRHLRRLFFYKCCIALPQPIPAALASLGATLEVLVLRRNGHVGDIPAELGSNLTNLQTLDLQGNSLSSSIPSSIGHLNNLLLLDLSHNQLSGKLPSSVSQLSSLCVLDLSFNYIQGPLADNMISGLISLKKLDLNHNNFTGPLPFGFQHLKQLLLLDLSFNSFQGALPPQLGQLSHLQTLILENAGQLGSAIPTALRHLSKLEVLVLTSTGLVGEIPDIFHQMGGLKIIRVDGNKLSGTVPESLGGLATLSELKLSGNLLAGALPFSHEFVWRLGRRLSVNNNVDLCFGHPLGSLALQGIHLCKNSSNPQILEEEEAPPMPPYSHTPHRHANPFTSHPFLHTSSTAHRLCHPLYSTSMLVALLLLLFMLAS